MGEPAPIVQVTGGRFLKGEEGVMENRKYTVVWAMTIHAGSAREACEDFLDEVNAAGNAILDVTEEVDAPPGVVHTRWSMPVGH